MSDYLLAGGIARVSGQSALPDAPVVPERRIRVRAPRLSRRHRMRP